MQGATASLIFNNTGSQVESDHALRWRDAVECSGLGLWEYNVITGDVLVSAGWADMLGYPREDVAQLALTGLDYVHPDDRSGLLVDLQAHLSGQTSEYHNEHRARHRDGHYFWVLSRGRIISRDAQGQPEWMVGTYSNINARKQLEQSRLEAEKVFRTTFEDAPIGMAMISPQGQWLDVNLALCHILGYSRNALMTMRFQDITHADDLEQGLALMQEMLAGTRRRYRLGKRYRHQLGRIVYAQLDVSLVWGDDGKPAYFISQIQDVSERHEMELALAHEKDLAQVTLAAIGDGVIRTDTHSTITFCNAAAASLLGIAADYALGKDFDSVVQLFSDRDQKRVASPVARVLKDGLPTGLPMQTQLRRFDGENTSIEDSAAPIRAEDGHLMGCVFVFHDVSQTRALANELQFQAHHDPLTGLPNRREFEAELTAKVASACSRRAVHVLLYLDLDRFKLINDTCGHAAGDVVLCALSTLMRKRLRSGDLLARLGGDEFGVLLDNCDALRGKQLAENLIRAVENYRFTHEGRTYQLGLSIGLALIDERVNDLNTLLSQADTACYIAKRRGRNRVQRYERDDAEVTRTEGDMHWINRLESAMSEGRLEVYAQRISSMQGLTVAGHETLMRLRERNGEILLPGAFLSAARRFGLTTRLDRWMVSQVHQWLETMQPQLLGYLTVNISGLSLSDEDFADFLLAMLDVRKVPAERLRFEITETDAFTSSENAGALVGQLRARGYKVLLDDFGSGFLSFEQLRSLSADGLKIDQTYTRELSQDALNRTIIESICRISRQMGLEVIAEGVEDAASLAVLRELGVDSVQGHLFHVAEPLNNILIAPGKPAVLASVRAAPPQRLSARG